MEEGHLALRCMQEYLLYTWPPTKDKLSGSYGGEDMSSEMGNGHFPAHLQDCGEWGCPVPQGEAWKFCTLGRALSGALFLLGIATTQVLQGQDGDWRGGSSTAWDPFSETKMRTGGQCQV